MSFLQGGNVGSLSWEKAVRNPCARLRLVRERFKERDTPRREEVKEVCFLSCTFTLRVEK
jgi:hypothetical protein